MGKSPAVAGVLSAVILGLGQAYNGQWMKMAALWGLALVVAFLSIAAPPLVILMFILYVYSVYDAIQVAD